MINTLSEGLRAILLLGEMGDLAFEVISDVVGIPVGTDRSRLNRARGRRREVIE